MNPNQPRLLADFAAVPTRKERAGTRRYWQTAQTGLDLFAPATSTACACCGSESHASTDCPHGEALAFDWHDAIASTMHDEPEPDYAYATAAECGADAPKVGPGMVDRTYVLTGSTRCDLCPGDLTDDDHYDDCDLMGKPRPWQTPDMFRQASLAAMGPRKTSTPNT